MSSGISLNCFCLFICFCFFLWLEVSRLHLYEYLFEAFHTYHSLQVSSLQGGQQGVVANMKVQWSLSEKTAKIREKARFMFGGGGRAI